MSGGSPIGVTGDLDEPFSEVFEGASTETFDGVDGDGRGVGYP
jgi:hypothetical protein